ncbi:class I SAM-dependent methyltransferase [Marivivens niveibacter]
MNRNRVALPSNPDQMRVMSTPENILATYDRVGPAWAQRRDRRLQERKWLDKMISAAPHHQGRRRVLDLGCGAGRPIAEYLADRGIAVTGVDGAQSMIALFRSVLPQQTAIHRDMRGLSLGQTYDAILAWDSFFHLSPADQRAMFPVFAAHAADNAALMFTSGPYEGVEIGEVEGEAVYHASLSPDEYRALLSENGFTELAFAPEDADCGGRTIWLARYKSTDH